MSACEGCGKNIHKTCGYYQRVFGDKTDTTCEECGEYLEECGVTICTMACADKHNGKYKRLNLLEMDEGLHLKCYFNRRYKLNRSGMADSDSDSDDFTEFVEHHENTRIKHRGIDKKPLKKRKIHALKQEAYETSKRQRLADKNTKGRKRASEFYNNYNHVNGFEIV